MGASSPPQVPAVTIPPPIPMSQSPQSLQAGATVANRAISAKGPSSMIDTGPQGLTTPATTANKTLLGS